MKTFQVRGILLDIEGTTSSIKYVYEVLFPFARKNIQSYLERYWNDPAIQGAFELMAKEAGFPSCDDWLGEADANHRLTQTGHRIEKVVREVNRLMDGDIKATGLKQLQGLVWEEGYKSGKLRSHVYEDVPPNLSKWRAANLDVRIFSSGSVVAQRVFFSHTDYGDLLPLFNGHYDTTVGPKREASSYSTIAKEMHLEARDVLFLSDTVAELDAALAAAMQTVLVVRPGNPPTGRSAHRTISSFDELPVAT